MLLLDTIGYYLILVDTGGGRSQRSEARNQRSEVREIFSQAGGISSVTSVTSVTNQCLRAFLRFSKRNKRSFVTLWEVGFGQCLSMLLRLLRLRIFGFVLRLIFDHGSSFVRSTMEDRSSFAGSLGTKSFGGQVHGFRG